MATFLGTEGDMAWRSFIKKIFGCLILAHLMTGLEFRIRMPVESFELLTSIFSRYWGLRYSAEHTLYLIIFLYWHILRATFTQAEFILWFADTQPLRVFVDSAAAPSTLSVLSRDTNVYEEASELIVRSISRPCVSLRFVLFQALSIDPHLVEKGDWHSYKRDEFWEYVVSCFDADTDGCLSFVIPFVCQKAVVS